MPKDLRKMEQAPPLAEWQRRSAQELLDQWIDVGRKIGSMDNVTVMTAVANLAAYLLCQHSDLTHAQERVDEFADHVREIVTSHFEEKGRYDR